MGRGWSGHQGNGGGGACQDGAGGGGHEGGFSIRAAGDDGHEGEVVGGSSGATRIVIGHLNRGDGVGFVVLTVGLVC